MSGWSPTKWGELATLEYGKAIRDYHDKTDGYPVFGTNGKIGFHDEALCPQPGVIVGRKGAYRGIHYSESAFFVIDTAFYLKPKTPFDLRWAYYQLRNFDINRLDSGSAIPSTSREAFYEIPVELPPLEIQTQIASILSAYDDLIENNTRRIKILEAMAQMLYQEWFVHFRFPGHQKVKMVESEWGPIPEGWRVGTLSDVARITSGFAFSSKDWVDSGIPVIKIANIKDDGDVDVENVDKVVPELLTPRMRSYELSNGDILIAMTGATAGKVGRVRSRDKLLLNQRVAKMDLAADYRSFAACTVMKPEQRRVFFRLADGAAQPNMSAKQIGGVPVVVPPVAIASQFENRVGMPGVPLKVTTPA
jgi:type I restriction enzyme S subunit